MLERKWPADKVLQALRPAADREFVNLSDVVAFVRRYLLSILICAGLGLVLALAYLVTTAPVYTAETEVLIEPKLPTALEQARPAEINLSLDTAQIESQIAVMRSEKVAAMVIAQLGLTHDVAFNSVETLAERGRKLLSLVSGGKWGGSGSPLTSGAMLGDGVSLQEPREAEFERERRTMMILRDNLDIRRMGVSYAIGISFSAGDPRLAAEVANAIAEAYVNEQVETRTEATNKGLDWLENRINQLRSQMNEAAEAAQKFRARHDYRIGGAAASSSAAFSADPADADAANQGIKKGVTLDELEATADSYRKLYESFLQAFTSSVNQQPAADARVITAATRPLAPSGPRRKLIMAFGVLAGLMGGLTLSFGRHMFDRSVVSAQQLRDELALDCIGALPTGQHGGFGRLDEVLQAPESAFSQGVRDIRAMIGMISLDKPIRMLGITSALPGDGKSTLAGNLAAAWAKSGTPTLLIDSDLSHAALTNTLLGTDDEANRHRLSSEPGGVVREIVVAPTQFYDFLSSRSVQENDLLMAGNLQQFLATLDGYEMVIVDLPPFTSGSEGLIASTQLDGVIIAAQWGRTPMDLLASLVSTLRMAKSSIIGVVFTKVRNPSMGRLRRLAGKAPR